MAVIIFIIVILIIFIVVTSRRKYNESEICPHGFFGLVAHPTEPDAYFLCSNWMPVLLRCSSGFVFDPENANLPGGQTCRPI